jgi:hypothetical protein
MHVDTIADWKNLTCGGGVHVLGASAAHDGGGGYLIYDATSTVPADDLLVYMPTSGVGRGFRVREGNFIRVDWAPVGSGGDHTAAFIAASAYPHVVLSNKTYMMNSTIAIKANQLWDFNGAIITHTDDSKVMFTATNVDGWNLRGPGTLRGTLVTSTVTAAEKGLVVSGCNKFRVSMISGHLFKNAAFYIAAGVFSGAKADQGQWSDCTATECMVAVQVDADSAAEYNVFTNFNASYNIESLIIGGGNTTFIGGTIAQNRHGPRLIGGPNNGHGKFIGVSINHNAQTNVWANGVTNGFTFTGCHIYGDGTPDVNGLPAGRVLIENGSTDINFVGGVLDATIVNDSGTNRVSHTKRYAQFAVTGALSAQLIQSDPF